jgi:hypothetical protein
VFGIARKAPMRRTPVAGSVTNIANASRDTGYIVACTAGTPVK